MELFSHQIQHYYNLLNLNNNNIQHIDGNKK